MAMSDAERQKRYRDRLKAGKPSPVLRFRRPADRRSKPRQWEDAVNTLLELLEGYQDWRDNLPPALGGSVTAERLDAVLELREQVEQLQGVELPKGFGRDG